jgi:circadian clock protein KaiB
MAKKTSIPCGDPSSLKKKLARRSAPQEPISSTADFEELLKKCHNREERYVLKLYITGTTTRAAQAVASIRQLCDAHLSGRYDLEVIDIYQQPAAASKDQIIAAPTLIKEEPAPSRRVVGNLTDKEKILLSLDIEPLAIQEPSPDQTRWIRL